MAAGRTCPRCGTEVKGQTLEGLCPECLLGEGLALEPASEPAAGGVGVAAGSGPRSGSSRFGDYELLEVIAHGGMGMVYKARQVSLDRLVALKMLLFGAHSSPAAVQRFRAEAVTAASLHHPNIVSIHEVGFCDGQHFLAMDYVKGRPLSALIAGKPLPPQRAAAYLRTIAEAVHHAHEHGILHRDLKPSNVLIDQEDQPRITDFGLAKRLESDSDLTVSGQVLGSPNYMSPEQAGGKRGALTRRSDIYSLGSMLYELLTGRPPFIGEGLAEIVPQVLNDEPLAPRTLNPSVPLDLQTVCLKCLEKEPEKRYETALGLAEELGRFMEGKPVLARPVGRLGKTWRWCRRQPARAALAGGLVLTFVLGSGGVFWQWRQAEQQRQLALTNEQLAQENERRAVQSELRTRRNAYAADMTLAQHAVEARDLGLAVSLLDQYRPTNGLGVAPGVSSPDLRHWEWRYLRQLCQGDELFTIAQYPTRVSCMRATSDGKFLAFRYDFDVVAVWDLIARRSLAELPAPASIWARNFAFIPRTGLLLLATTGSDGYSEVVIWDANLGQEKERFAVTKPVWALTISPDATCLALLHEKGEVAILDLASKQVLQKYSAGSGKMAADDLLFSRDGDRLVISQGDGGIHVLDWRTGIKLPDGFSKESDNSLNVALPGSPTEDHSAHLTHAASVIVALAGSPTEDLVAWAGSADKNLIWLGDLVGGKPLGEPLRGHTGWIVALVFSPDGQVLASASADRSIRLWNVAQRKETRCLQGHLDEVWGLAFLPDGDTLLSGGKDGSVRLWNLAAPDHSSGYTKLPTLLQGRALAFSSDSQRFITHCQDASVRLWSAHPLKELERLSFLRTNILGVDLSADGRWFAAAEATGRLGLWDWSTRQAITNLVIPPAAAAEVAFCADSKYLFAEVVPTNSCLIRLGWETGTWKPLPNGPGLGQTGVFSMAWSPAGMWATGHRQGKVKLWTFPAQELLTEYSGHSADVLGLAFSPDGRLLASTSNDSSVNLYDIAARRSLRHFQAHFNSAQSVCFSPDGGRLATLGTPGDSAVKLWDLETFRPLLALQGSGISYFRAAFSPDGGTLVALDRYGIVDVWHAPSFAELEAAERAKAPPAPNP